MAIRDFFSKLYHKKYAALKRSNLLELAKRHQRAHEWDEAIACYEKYIDKHSGNVSDAVYAVCARLLRVHGDQGRVRAEEVLDRGASVHPLSKKIWSGYYALYSATGRWSDAKRAARKLIEVDPEDPESYLKLGRSYAWLARPDSAAKAYSKGLIQKHGKPLKELVDEIHESIVRDRSTEVEWEYSLVDGKNNYGAIIHTLDDGKRYFTKIFKKNTSAQQEDVFHTRIVAAHPSLKSITPACVDARTVDDICYLTTEMIVGDYPKKHDIHRVIKAARVISQVKYQDISKSEYLKRKRSFHLTTRSFSAIQFFSQIHRKKRNEKLISSLRIMMGDDKAALSVVERLRYLIVDTQAYSAMSPERHYSLLHGDFIPGNVRIDKATDAAKVFDWASFTTGPHFVDVVRYMVVASISYKSVNEHYLFNDEVEELSSVERIIFLYAFIVMHLITLQGRGSRPREAATAMRDFIKPALKDMESLILEWKRDGKKTSN